jgi:hypothetical protein
VGLLIVLPACSVRFPSTDGYQFDFQGETAVRQLDGQVPADIDTVEVNNQFGDVTIEATDDEPAWSWELTCWSKDSATAEVLADAVELKVDQQGGRQSWIVVLPQAPVPELRGVRSHLVLRLPASVKAIVTNSFGDTSIQGVQERGVVESRHGSVELVDVAGSLDVTNQHGTIRASRIGAAHLNNRHGKITVHEATGNLVIHHRHGEVIVEQVLGHLEVAGEHGSVSVRGVTGPATIRAAFAPIHVEDAQETVSLTNRHGGITVRRVAGRLEMVNEHGSIAADVESPEVLCECEHGAIDLCLRNPQFRQVEAETAFADLTVRLTAQSSPHIEAEVKFGKVRSDFPVLMAGADSGERPDPEASEAIDGRIMLRNRHGDIRVEKLPAPVANDD